MADCLDWDLRLFYAARDLSRTRSFIAPFVTDATVTLMNCSRINW